jgi:hypothetical protein
MVGRDVGVGGSVELGGGIYRVFFLLVPREGGGGEVVPGGDVEIGAVVCDGAVRVGTEVTGSEGVPAGVDDGVGTGKSSVYPV